MPIDPGSKEETYLILKYGNNYEAILVSRWHRNMGRNTGPLEKMVCQDYRNRILKLLNEQQQ